MRSSTRPSVAAGRCAARQSADPPSKAAAPVVVSRAQAIVRFAEPGIPRRSRFLSAYLVNYVLGGGGFPRA
jgi:hypothetical protein